MMSSALLSNCKYIKRGANYAGDLVIVKLQFPLKHKYLTNTVDNSSVLDSYM
ncbi:UNVERIFIED_CONTAM: hypothetical protein Sindi_0202300, partial [Sesamum indicum]